MFEEYKIVPDSRAPRQQEEFLSGEFTFPAEIELHNLITSEAFAKDYLNVQTAEERLALKKLLDTPRQSASKRISEMIETAAMRALGEVDITSARKRGKEFGIARGRIKELAYNGVAYPLDVRSSNEDLIDVLAKEYPPSGENLVAAQKQYDAAMQNARTQIEQLYNELLSYRGKDEELRAALEVWGNSLNAEGIAGETGKGFNAGVVHFFEYRAHQEKSARFKRQDTDPSIKEFIIRSKQIGALVDGYESNDDIDQYAVVSDELGQKRLYILSNDELVIAFQKPGDNMRVVSILPGISQKDFEKRVDTEIKRDSKGVARLNSLGQERQLLDRK